MDVIAMTSAVQPGLSELFALSAMAGCAVVLAFCVYMLFRNHMVHRWLMKRIEEAYTDSCLDEIFQAETMEELLELERQQQDRELAWKKMPTYNEMMWTWWVWPLDRFLPDAQPETTKES